MGLFVEMRGSDGGGLLDADTLVDFKDPAPFLVSLFKVVCSILRHDVRALDSGTGRRRLTYFQPTHTPHLVQYMSRTTCLPVVICLSWGSPYFTLTLSELSHEIDI